VRKLMLLGLALLLSGCMHSGVPIDKVSANWIDSTCKPVPYSEIRKCSSFSNCSNQIANNETICRCTWDDGTSLFVGNMKGKDSWCGVGKDNDLSYLVVNGERTEQKVGVNWGDTALLIVGVAAAAALVNEAADSGGGYPSTSSNNQDDDKPFSKTDFDWDWDGFWNSGSYVWMCRGIQTGRFASNDKCQYDFKDDDRWPTN
jgi:hypothetical protein